MESLIAPVEGKGVTVDETSRLKLRHALRALRGAPDSMKTPYDIMLRWLSAVHDCRHDANG